jgi:hypothetical protein
MSAIPKVYIYISLSSERGDWHSGVAIAEDGTVLASKSLSSRRFLRKDLGSRPAYRAHFPGGFEVVEVWNAQKHEGLQEALRKAAA